MKPEELVEGGMYFTESCFSPPKFYTQRPDGTLRLGRDKVSKSGHYAWFHPGDMLTYVGKKKDRFIFLQVDGLELHIIPAPPGTIYAPGGRSALGSIERPTEIPVITASEFMARTIKVINDLNELKEEAEKKL